MLVLVTACATSSSLDVGPIDAPAIDAPYLGYCPEAAFPSSWARACGSAGDCFLASHTRDCCGGQVLMSLSSGERSRFEAAEARVEATCPATCECLSGTVLEDGTAVGDPGLVVADCLAGTCVARLPMR